MSDDSPGPGLRPPSQVMSPAWLGAVRQTRYSFARSLIRRAAAGGWSIEATSVDLDAEGRGEVVLRVDTGSHRFHFVAFTTTFDESAHTDRVVADRWEITAALAEGPLTADLHELLRREVPRQERGRLDHRVLVLTRGNRSVRFFQYVVDALAAGRQPEPDLVADAGYLMRSTAFYGNGKFGLRSFGGYGPDHPLAAPYRAQMLCAWLFRELSYLVVEHRARAAGGPTATRLADGWDTYFGLGNATGLGLVTYACRHPAIIGAWALTRERALAEVRGMPGSAEAVAAFSWWIDRAIAHFRTGSDDDCSPFLNGAALGPVAAEIGRRFEAWRDDPLPFDRLYRWAEAEGPETAELVVSLLIELHDGADRAVDEGLVVAERTAVDPGLQVGELRSALARVPWLAELDLDGPGADWYWWLVSDNTYEPRRAPRRALDPGNREVGNDAALRLHHLAAQLDRWPDDTPVHHLLAAHPEHRLAVARLVDHHPYGEPRDNACAREYLPLLVQRFQLAQYGMDNFKPKSTDWLRVTLYQGAPRVGALGGSPATGERARALDRWPLPPRPARGGTATCW